MRCPGGRSPRSTRAQKSLSAVATGPATRRALLKDGAVSHSTARRAMRALLLHTMPERDVTSPLCTPYGTRGRRLSEGTAAGAAEAAECGGGGHGAGGGGAAAISRTGGGAGGISGPQPRSAPPEVASAARRKARRSGG